MKKLYAFLCTLLILLMAFSLAGCGGGGSGSGGTSTPSGGGSTSTPSGGGSTTTPSGGGSTTTPSGGGSTPAPAGSTGGVAVAGNEFVSIRIGVSDFLGRFIQGLVPTESWILCDAVYDQILKVNPSTKLLESDCLDDWYYEDPTTLIMKLKPNVVFSNGMKATAEDLLYSYTSAVDRGSTQISGWGPIVWDECKVRDEYTIQLKWASPYRVFTNASVHLLCKEWALSLANGWEDMAWYMPIGSGLYTVEEYVPEDLCVLRARDDYWNKAVVGPTYVDEWIVKFYKDASTMYMDLEVGAIKLAEAQATDYSRYVRSGVKGDGFDLYLIKTGVTQYFCFSETDFPAWGDRRLREAIAIGTNWEELGIVAYDELYIKATSILPADSPLYINPGQYEYNPARAKELLTEAGYGPNNPLKLATTLMDSQLYKALGENMQFQMSQLGIDLELTYLDIMSAINVWNSPGGTDIGFHWSISGSATFDLYQCIPGATRETGNTYLRVLDPKFRELWNTMVFNTDPAIYEPAIKELQQYNFDDIRYIPYYEFTGGIGFRTDTFTLEQLQTCIYGVNMYQIGRLGLLSSWKQP